MSFYSISFYSFIFYIVYRAFELTALYHISWSLAKLYILLCNSPHPHPTPVYILQSHCIFVALYFLQLLYTLQSCCILCSTVPTVTLHFTDLVHPLQHYTSVTLHFTDLVHPLQHRTFHSYHTLYRSNASFATLYLSYPTLYRPSASFAAPYLSQLTYALQI